MNDNLNFCLYVLKILFSEFLHKFFQNIQNDKIVNTLSKAPLQQSFILKIGISCDILDRT